MNEKNAEDKIIGEDGEEIYLISTISNDYGNIYCLFSDKNFYQNKNNEYFKITDENLIKKLLENFKPGFSDVIRSEKGSRKSTKIKLENLPEIELPKL